MRNTKEYDLRLKRLAREVADPELKSALLELADARDALTMSMEAFEKLHTSIDELQLSEEYKELMHNTLSNMAFHRNDFDGISKGQLAVAFEMADKKESFEVRLNKIKEETAQMVNDAYELATDTYTEFVDHAMESYENVKDSVGQAASGVANVVNDALIAGAKKTAEIQEAAKNTVDKGIDALTKAKDAVISFGKDKVSDAKNAIMKAEVKLLEVSIFVKNKKLEQLDKMHRTADKAGSFFRNHATGIIMSSEIIRESRNAAAAELEKVGIEKQYECSETNRNWCKALLKECSLYPDRTKEENVHAVNEKFAQAKEVAIANLEKSGQNGPGKVASMIAGCFDKIADVLDDAKAKVAKEYKDTKDKLVSMEKEKEDIVKD